MVRIGCIVPESREIERACSALQQLRRRLAVETPNGKTTPGLLQATLDECPDPALIVDDVARIIMVNGAVARLLGVSTRELRTLTVWDITHPSQQSDFDVLWREFLRAGRQRGRYGLRRHDGAVVEVAYCAEAKALDSWGAVVLRPLG